MNAKLGVIFDMDGVLVDSYRAHYQSWKMLAAAHGLSLTEAQFASTFGRPSREIIADRWAAHEFTERQILAMDAEKEATYRKIVSQDLPAMEGIVELLDSLHAAGFALAIGSSGPPGNVELVMEKLGRRELFAATVNGSDVTRGKPDPQVFLIAAERLGLPPENCAVIEDASAGIAAARTAGMTAIGLVSTGRTRDDLAAADLVVDRLAELSPERIRQLIEARRRTA